MAVTFGPTQQTHWSYESFGDFCAKLGAIAGVDVDTREFIYTPRGGSWEKLSDPLAAFLNHSSSDGILTPELCRTVAPRLREAVAEWPVTDRDRAEAMKLASDMEICAEEDLPLEMIC